MSRIIEKLPHSCGTSDALQVWEDEGGSFNGWCFACSTYVENPYKGVKRKAGRPKKIAEDTIENLSVISHYQCIARPERKLKQWALDYFGIKHAVSEEDGVSPLLEFYPYYKKEELSAYKTRVIKNKKMWSVGDIKKSDLFGWKQAIASGAKRLYITEGEIDAVTVYQVLKERNKGTDYEHFEPAVCSLINGASSVNNDLSRHLNDIRVNFRQVVIVFDQDETGEEASRQASKLLPNVQTVLLPAKDPNDSLKKGYEKGLCNALLFKAAVPKNTRLIQGSTLYQAGREQAQWGLSWPWKGLTEMTRGIRFGETYYIGAGVKLGKSELVNTIAAHLIIEHGLKVFLAKPEEINKKTYQMVLGKVVGRHFHDPKVEFDYDAYDKASKRIGDKLFMLSLYQHLGWDSLRSDILLSVQEGCRAVFIDPITNLVNGIDSGQTNTILQEIAQELAALAKDLDIVIFIFCHLKAPLSGDPHERGGKVYSHQFSGSRAMMRSCQMMLGLEGDKDPDLEVEQRNTRKLIILEDRIFGESGFIRLYWDKKTGLFSEIKE